MFTFIIESMLRRANPGFSLPLTLIFLVALIILYVLFGWVVLPIALGIFLFASLSLAVHDRIKRSKGQRYRPDKGELAFEAKSDHLNLILYRAIFNRSEEQAKAIAEDMNRREPSDSIASAVSEIQNELDTPSQRLADLHPFAGDPTEEEIRAFLTMVLRELREWNK